MFLSNPELTISASIWPKDIWPWITFIIQFKLIEASGVQKSKESSNYIYNSSQRAVQPLKAPLQGAWWNTEVLVPLEDPTARKEQINRLAWQRNIMVYHLPQVRSMRDDIRRYVYRRFVNLHAALDKLDKKMTLCMGWFPQGVRKPSRLYQEGRKSVVRPLSQQK